MFNKNNTPPLAPDLSHTFMKGVMEKFEGKPPLTIDGQRVSVRALGVTTLVLDIVYPPVDFQRLDEQLKIGDSCVHVTMQFDRETGRPDASSSEKFFCRATSSPQEITRYGEKKIDLEQVPSDKVAVDIGKIIRQLQAYLTALPR